MTAGDPQVVEQRHPRCRVADRRRRATPAEHAIQQRVQRQQHEVMQQRGADEPGDPVDDRAAAEDLADRPGGDEEGDQVAEQMQRAGAVEAAEPGDHAAMKRHRGDPLGAVHARQRGDDDPRRVAVIERQIGAVDAQREQRAIVGDLVGGEGGLRETGRPGCSERDSRIVAAARRPRAGAGRPAARPSSAASSTSPRRRRSASRRCTAASPSSCARLRIACVRRRDGSAASRDRTASLVTPTGVGRLVDLEVVGPGAEHASARREQREPAQRAADRLAEVGDQQRQRSAADERQQAAAADRRRRPGDCGASPPGSYGSGRVCGEVRPAAA